MGQALGCARHWNRWFRRQNRARQRQWLRCRAQCADRRLGQARARADGRSRGPGCVRFDRQGHLHDVA